MCPLCLSTLAWLAGGGSAVSAGMLWAGWRLKGKDDDNDDDETSDRDA
jgi:hypothetical protein